MARISDRSLHTARSSEQEIRDIVARRNAKLAAQSQGPRKRRVKSDALHGKLGDASPRLQAEIARVEKYLDEMNKPYRRGS